MDQTTKLSQANPDGCGPAKFLDFEGHLAALEAQICELEGFWESKKIDFSSQIRQLNEELLHLTAQIYDNLSAWQTVQIARHPQRPVLRDYLDIIVRDFRELHGDRYFADDRAVIAGFGRIEREKVMIVGHNKGRNVKENAACNFGYPHPEGCRKALRAMKLGEKFRLPIVCLIDTPGAYPGLAAEERGQAQAIARNLMEMSRLRVPIICVITGEGGSGGALSIGVGDRLAMMQFSYYSVISPEGCAAILWKNDKQTPAAAAALKLTSKDLKGLGMLDAVIPEPLGGAQRNPREAAQNLKEYIVKTVKGLRRYRIDNLVENRYQKFRRIGSGFQL